MNLTQLVTLTTIVDSEELSALDSSKYFEILTTFILSYNITGMMIAIPEFSLFKTNNLLKKLWTIPNIKFGVHTVDSRLTKPYEHFKLNQDLLLLSSDTFKEFSGIEFGSKLGSLAESKLIAVIGLSNNDYSLAKFSYVFRHCNAIILQNGSSLGSSNRGNISPDQSSVNKFIAKDIFSLPEAYWPNLVPSFPPIDKYFPLLTYSKEKQTGLIAYLAYAFCDHVRTRIRNKLGAHTKSVTRPIDVKPEVSNNIYDGYPFLKDEGCFMLPLQNEILTQDFLRKPFTKLTWIAVLFFILYLSLVLRTCVSKRSFVAFMECLTITFGSSYKGLQEGNVLKQIVYIQLYAYGFIISNLYLSKLSSYLTSPNLGTLIDTLEELKAVNLTVLAAFEGYIVPNESYLRRMHPGFYEYYKKLGSQCTITRAFDFYRDLMDFNTTFGYFIPDYQWSFIDRKQTLLVRKLFSFSKMCPSNGFVYPLRVHDNNIDLREFLGVFYMRVSESGLQSIWETFTYSDLDFHYLRVPFEPLIILGFEYFEVAWLILAIGILLSVLGFLVEVLRFKF